MSTLIRFVGSLVGGLFLIVLIGAGIGVYYLFVYGPGLAETNQSESSGDEYGKRTDNVGCLQESLSRITNQESVTEIISKNVFLSSCLKASQATPGFCEGVPKRTDRVRSMEWAGQRCAAAKRTGRACLASMQLVQTYCESPNYRPGPQIPVGAEPPDGPQPEQPAEDPEGQPPEIDPDDRDPRDQQDPRDRGKPNPREEQPQDQDAEEPNPRDRRRDDRDPRERDEDVRRGDRGSRGPDWDDRDRRGRDREDAEYPHHRRRRRFPW